ncbi:hypothetical protein GWI33_006848 [Rhynchophorus ferrugineus]|uniref:Transmembrane protein 214-A n=1 Tax=Rhynchophorus ferrugineus TaxID=354439 RepID=A0A834ITV0_RHYFE|nr:hypothetical protein GWI33_006848 [Rhynchophorus ferrugineus]
MSGQWEVVRGKSDRRNKPQPPKSANKPAEQKNKKNILNNVKLEELLPKSQVQNLYSGKQNNKEQHKQQEKVKHKEPKKQETKKPKAPPEPPKPKPPKSIEAGLIAINSEEFKTLYEKTKKAYPDAPILWLKELTQFLNQKICLEISDPVFSSKPQGFPYNVVPSSIKNVIEKAIKEAGKNNAQLYFDIALTSMVTDLSKGLPAVGYRFFLQYIALSEPKLVTENLSKHVVLRNSYQNRANVALAILWALSHVGTNDLKCGLKVFEELMLPLIEMKNYSKYVVKYLLDLISQKEKVQITKEQYLLILDIIYTNRKNFPVELQKELYVQAPQLKSFLFANSKERYHNYVEPFLKRLSMTTNSSYQNVLCDTIIEIFTKDQSTMAHWNKIYIKNLSSSAILLNYISDNYDNINSCVSKVLKDLLVNFSNTNKELSLKKRKDDGLKPAINAIAKLQARKTAPKCKSGLCRRLFVFSFFVVLLFVITEPLRCPNTPREDLYMTRANDVGKVIFNIQENVRQTCVGYVKEKYPVIMASVDSYAPGFIDNTKTIFTDAFAKSINYYRISVNYLQKEVFVGQLSPENIQKVIGQAYNTTSEKAIEYYHWVYEKVQTTIK